MSDSTRREAAPCEPEGLTESQQEAATSFMVIARNLLEETKDAPQTTTPPPRRNRLLFWTGEPGVGKTSTYLAVRSWFKDPKKAQFTGSSASAPPPSDKLKRLKAAMSKLEPRRVRWLHSLELELLAGHPNFLAAVLARIDDDLGSTDSSDLSWSQPGDSDRRKAEKELRQLQNDIALSWEGNLRERGPALEPDVYASEVMLAERARLNVNNRFREVLEKLASHADGCDSENPALFVLPIDDFYLKPEVTLELLRFLRMISSPNLLVLMLGDIDVVKDLVFWHSIGEASRLIQDPSGTLLDTDGQLDARRRAMSMASAALHKLIPKNQQVTIDSMNPEETLSFSQSGISTQANSEETDLMTVDRLLEKTGLSFLITAQNEDFVESPVWYLRDALQLTPRQVADFHKQLATLVREHSANDGRVPYEHKQPDFSKMKIEEDEKIWATCELVAVQVERALYSNVSKMDPTQADKIWAEMLDPLYFHRWRFPKSVVAEPVQNMRFKLSFRGSDDSSVPLSPLAQAWLAVLHDLLVTMNPKLNLNITVGNKPLYKAKVKNGRPTKKSS